MSWKMKRLAAIVLMGILFFSGCAANTNQTQTVDSRLALMEAAPSTEAVVNEAEQAELQTAATENAAEATLQSTHVPLLSLMPTYEEYMERLRKTNDKAGGIFNIETSGTGTVTGSLHPDGDYQWTNITLPPFLIKACYPANAPHFLSDLHVTFSWTTAVEYDLILTYVDGFYACLTNTYLPHLTFTECLNSLLQNGSSEWDNKTVETTLREEGVEYCLNVTFDNIDKVDNNDDLTVSCLVFEMHIDPDYMVEVDKAVADSIVQQDQDTSTHSTGYQPSSEPSYVGPIVNDGPGIAEYPDPPFQVEIDSDSVEIYQGPGSDYRSTGSTTGTGVFTIVEVQPGPGSYSGWGRLKSDAGWIALDDCSLYQSLDTSATSAGQRPLAGTDYDSPTVPGDVETAAAHVHTDACRRWVVDVPYKAAEYREEIVVDVPYSPAHYEEQLVEVVDHTFYVRQYHDRYSFTHAEYDELSFSTEQAFLDWIFQYDIKYDGVTFTDPLEEHLKKLKYDLDYKSKSDKACIVLGDGTRNCIEWQKESEYTRVESQQVLIPEQPEESHIERVLVTPEQPEQGHWEYSCGY